MKIKKKLLPLALALNLLFPTTPAVFAEDVPTEEQQQTEKTQDPAPTDPDHAEKSKTADTETKKTNGTTWDGSGLSTCQPNMFCDGAPTQQTSDWANILTMIGILFGESGSSSNDGSGLNGTSGYDTIGTPTVDNTNTVNMPEGDFSTITPTGTTDENWKDVPTGPDMAGITPGILGGIPISANASYTYSYVGPGSFKVSAMVNPLNPEVDQSTLFTALVTPTKASVHVSPPSQSVSQTYTKGGIYSQVFRFTTMEYATNSKPRYGQLIVKVSANVYEGTTALCSQSDSECNNGTVSGDEFGNLPTTGTNTVNTGSSDIGGSLTGGNSGSGNLLDNIFGNGSGSTSGSGSNNTANANNPSWLEDGFSNIAQQNGDSVPSDFGSQFVDNSGNTAPIDSSTGLPVAQNSTEYAQNGQPYTDTGNVGNTGNYTSFEPTSSSTIQAENPADSTLGSIFAKVDTAIGNDPSSSNSLTSKFASLTNKTSSAIESATGFNLKGDKAATGLPGNERGLSYDTTAELREMATRMLSAAGMSQDDMKKGKMFDAGSAYTDPADSWNLNRMNSSKAKATVSQNQTKSTNQKTTTIE